MHVKPLVSMHMSVAMSDGGGHVAACVCVDDQQLQ